MTTNEHVLGQWSIAYLPPAGGRYPGQLRVTDRRVVFAAQVPPDRFSQVVTEPLDCEAMACALDLDPPNVAYDGIHLYISIPAAQIECVTAEEWLLHHCVNLTIKHNGSIQQFEKGVFPVAGVVRAIRQATQLSS